MTTDDRSEDTLAELKSLVDEVDPCPAEVSSFAKAALGWRRIDAELAELLSDSALDTTPALARSGVLQARSVTFKGGGLEIDVSIHEQGSGRLLLGQLAPPSRATIEVQRDDSTTAATTETDALGRFRVELSASGRIRLRILRDAPAPHLETSWIAI